MKKRTYFRYLFVGIIFFANTDCKKVVEPTNTTINPPPPPPPPSPPPIRGNTAPKCATGQDIHLSTPTNFCTLYGSASDQENNITTISWSKISGPSYYIIEHRDSLSTRISDLQLGIYEFELKVFDSGGLSAKDTIKVTLEPLIYNNNKEIILENLIWGNQGLTTTLLWGTAIIIPNIYQYLPTPNIPFTTYIKRDNSTTWDALIPGNSNSYYVMNLVNGTMVIWSSYDETDTPDIKLVY